MRHLLLQLRRTREWATWLLGLAFVVVGLNHFLNPRFYIRIMPPYLPWHAQLVWLSGVFEVALGALVLIPRYRRLGAWGLIPLLIAIFPANIHMAVNADQYPDIPATALWLRLPLQGVFIAWAYWVGEQETSV